MKKTLIVLIGLSVLAGCTPPTATLMLLEQAKRSLAMAQEREDALHKELQASNEKQMKVLSVGFDNDVMLCASGQIKKDDGTVVQFTPEWVIESRKGYAAGIVTIADNIRKQEASHMNASDNNKAGVQMLDNASTIIINMQNIDANLKGWQMDTWRKATE